ncbi:MULTISPECIES: type I phosphomannose isomerase catalytic subunit [unclassified Leptolyngbya]|uniref:type I phosphomannose isomerase catalytic subunit n=1 Tax=unclassified Leptolyngbya TaxID=2650499 RepID=UPI001688CFD0|nr:MULTISPECIES: type I phosphomannose isomerase catalytic subunit [unclassified Leptolyngbya]MBD1911433.1 mannose-6-phosphate isomerase [Leptolyngbya sp. FACHB-8]MBD2153445.1 mannose-6-phosphate isomerase [Leptolyngbya sp. FACHB-16]
MNWYPIKLTAHVRHYAFGERLIPDRLHKQNMPEGIIAETWEISDYRDTTGTVTNGSFAGKTLHDLIQSDPDELVGQGWRGPHFPLLEKFLDASHMLPVHLHADDEIAARVYNEPNGKTEAWHILWAAPGATILAGLKGDFSREELFEAFVNKDYDAVIHRYPIQAGDTIYVPGGIIHSFGPDALVFEVQQTSDLGQFVMPHDLYGQPLSTEQWHANINGTLDELKNHYHPRPNPGLVLESEPNRRVLCCAGPYFAMERWTLTAPHTEPSHPHRCSTLTNVGDHAVELQFAGGTESLPPGESCILPAAIGQVQIVPQGEASLVVCYVPDMAMDVVGPLQAAGYEDEQIQQLGEVAVH